MMANMDTPEVGPVREFSREPGVWFYRQPGGCFEVGQEDPMTGVQDCVHICGDDVQVFIAELTAFTAETAETEA